MKKFVLIMLSLLLIGCTTHPNTVCFESSCFEVELAITQDERAQGLMHREQLDDNRGMLFIFDESGEYPFWMKNTLIPLDIIWINEDLEVVFIAKDVRPCTADPCPSINPGQDARFVLELNARKADEIGLEKGDKAEFNLEGNVLQSPISWI